LACVEERRGEERRGEETGRGPLPNSLSSPENRLTRQEGQEQEKHDQEAEEVHLLAWEAAWQSEDEVMQRLDSTVSRKWGRLI